MLIFRSSWSLGKRKQLLLRRKCQDRALKSMTLCNKFEIHYLFNDVLVSLLYILIPCVILYKHSCMHLLHYIWLRYIKSCTEYLSHEFFINRWLIHNCFMGLRNSLQVVVRQLLIGWMVGLSYWDELPMVCVLVCMVTHWTRPTVSNDLKLSSNHDVTKLLHCVVSQPWENIKFVLKLVMILTYG